MQKTFHVIPHTHWDFEWYFSTHESLIQLIYHLDEVMSGLESGVSDTYLLDGQLSIVEDYLNACPDQKARFKALVEQGKLIIGPWYTQTDQLIISGESIVRNLATGIRMGRQLGPVMEIGYVPDSFGQSIDMPKIYNGFGINKTVFWRGLNSDTCSSREFLWQAEDGCEITAYNIKNGYFVGSHIIGCDDPTALCLQAEEGATAKNVAIPLGGDQRYIDMDIKPRIALSNRTAPEFHLIESSYEKLFEALDKENLDLPKVTGEFIDGQVSKIHRSIYSTRYDHKNLNDKIERRLTYQLEPLMVMASQQGIEPKPQLVENIWKVLMRNHAHDSAGGCNTDKTNKIILARFEEADQMSGSAVDYLVRKLAESQSKEGLNEETDRLTLFNTLPYARTPVIRVNIATHTPDFALTDWQGNPVPFDIHHVEKTYSGSIKRTEAEQDPDLYYYQTEVSFRYPLPASGFECLKVVSGHVGQSAPVICDMLSGHNEIENAQYRLAFHDGQFDLYSKAQDKWFFDCIRLTNAGDDGDNYDYSPPEQDWKLTYNWGEASVETETGRLGQRLVVTGCWNLPEDLAQRNRHETGGKVAFTLRFNLKKSDCLDGLPLEIQAEFDNQVKDHRMQLVFSGFTNATSNFADTPFGTVERENLPSHLHDWWESGWKEEPSPIYPMLHFANMHDSATSLTVMAKGIKEYEITASGELALTLYRCVGWLGKPDLIRRPGIASGQQFKWIPTPDSQLQGKLHFDCALLVEETFNPAHCQKVWQHYAVEVLDYQNQSLNQFTNTLKYFVMHPLNNTVPDNDTGLVLSVEKLVLSAVKLADNGNGMVIRLYNPASEPVSNPGEVTLPYGFDQVEEVNLLEEKLAGCECTEQSFKLDSFKPKQIRTYRIY